MFDRTQDRVAHPRPQPFGTAIVATVIALAAISIAMLVLPGISFALLAPDLDLVVNTAAVLVASAVAMLAWIRYQESGRPHELYQAGAFLTLFAGGALVLVIVLTGSGQWLGFSLSQPSQVPVYLWIVQRLLVALLFVLGGWAGLRGWSRGPRHPAWVLLGPLVVLAAATALLFAFSDALPVIRDLGSLAIVSTGMEVIDPSGVEPMLVIVELAIACLFVFAALLYGRMYRRDGRRSLAYLEAGLLVAAFVQVHSLFVPTFYPGLLTSVDLFRVAFYVVVLVSVAVAARDDLRTLLAANQELRRLRDAAVRAAMLEERARLAREIHDGLAQDLWLARLKAGQLLETDGLPPEAVRIGGELGGALDAAHGHARQALTSVAPEGSVDLRLGSSLAAVAADLGSRYEPDLELDIPTDLPPIDPRVVTETTAIVREAVTNAGKHADATRIDVRARHEEGVLTVTVADNGRGFPPGGGRSNFGLRSMQERAASIGAELEIESKPHDGTRIELHVGVPQSQASAARADQLAPARRGTGALVNS